MKFLQILVLLMVVALVACGGGGGSNSSGSSSTAQSGKYSLSLDQATIEFEKMNTDTSVITKEVNISYKGDGVIVGYPPGASQPMWLNVDASTTATGKAKLTVSVVGGVLYSPGYYQATLRVITGNQSGTDYVYKDIAVSLNVDQPFDVTTSENLDFLLVGENTNAISPSSYEFIIRGGRSDWTIFSSQPWVTFDKTSGKGAAKVLLSLKESALPAMSGEAQIKVKDQTTSVEKSFVVSLERKPQDMGTPIIEGIPFEYNFEINDLLIDSVNKKIYAVDSVMRRLYVINSSNGLAEKYFSFDLIPHSLALTPDSKKLYVSLLTRENSPYYWTEDQTGRMAVFDAVSMQLVNEFKLNVSPGDMVVTSDNQLIVGAGSDQHVYFYFYNASTGNFVKKSSGTYSPITHMLLLPSEKSFYYSVSWTGHPPVSRFDIAQETFSKYRLDSPHGDWTSTVDFWLNPDSSYGITTEGNLFKTSDTSYIKRITDSYIYIKTAAFDSVNNRLVLVNWSEKYENRGYQQLVEYDATTWELRRVLEEPFSDVIQLLYLNNKMYILKKQDNSYRLEVLPY